MKQNEEWDYFKTHLNPLLSSSLLLKEATKTATITDSEVDATSTTPSELDTVAAVDGISDSMLEIIREGIIYHFAEGGLFKRSKWIPTHVVFTARGFIHLFPLDEDTAASLPPNRTSNPVIFSSDPSASLYLPNFDLSTLLTAEEPPASTAHKRQSKSSNRNSVFNQELLLFPLGLTEFKISERPPTGLLSSFSKRLREDRFGFANRDTAEFWWQLMSEKCVNTRQNGATAQQSSSVSSILALPSFSSLSITTSDTTKTAVAEKPVLQEERHVGEGGAVKELSGLSPSSSSSSIATSSSASLLLNRSSSSSSTYSNSSSTKLDMSSSSLETIPESGGVRDGSSSSGDKDGIVVSLNEPIKENPWGNV